MQAIYEQKIINTFLLKCVQGAAAAPGGSDADGKLYRF